MSPEERALKERVAVVLRRIHGTAGYLDPVHIDFWLDANAGAPGAHPISVDDLAGLIVAEVSS